MFYGKRLLLVSVGALLLPLELSAKDISCGPLSITLDSRPGKLRSETLLAQGNGAALPSTGNASTLAAQPNFAAFAMHAPLGASGSQNALALRLTQYASRDPSASERVSKALEGIQGQAFNRIAPDKSIQSKNRQFDGKLIELEKSGARPVGATGADLEERFKSILKDDPRRGDPLILIRPDGLNTPLVPQVKPGALQGAVTLPLSDPRRQIPMAGQSVVNTAQLDRPTSSRNMCRLQKVHGVLAVRCLVPGAERVEKNELPVMQCSAQTTTNWVSSQDQVSSITGTPIPALVRDYLRDPQQFKAVKSDKLVAAVSLHIKRTEELLDNCFQPVENSSFSQRSKVLDIVGKLMIGGEAVCTATLAGSSQYILTARHCFTKIPASLKNEKIWFQPAASPDRFQVCAVAEANALDAAKSTDITQDQVLARIAVTSVSPRPLEILAPANLLSTSDEAKGNTQAPTLLTTVSFFPLATLVRPQHYKSGFVQDHAEICAAVKVQKGCFTHVCSVVSGGSGAPIFVSNAASLVLAGTHVGGSNEHGLACKSDLSTRSNTAVLMNGVYTPALFQ